MPPKTAKEQAALLLFLDEAAKVSTRLKSELWGLRAAEQAYTKALINGASHTKESLKIYKDQIRQHKKIEDALKRAKNVTATYRDEMVKLQKVMKTMGGESQRLIGTIGKLTGALGLTGISFGSVVKTGLQYNRVLFEIQRTQQVAGKGSKDLAVALAYVKKNTTLSATQFAELANTIQTSFLGIKPTIMSTAKLVEAVGVQFGYSMEAQKKAVQSLMTIQNQQPALYDKIDKGMKKVAQASKTGRVTQAIKDESKALMDGIALRALATDMEQGLMDVALQSVAVRTHGQAQLLKMEEEAAKASKAMEDAKLEFYKTLQPYIIDATKATAKLITVMGDYNKVVIAGILAWTAFKGVNQMLLFTSATQGATAALAQYNKVKAIANMLSPITAAVTGIVAAGMAWKFATNERKKAKEEMKGENDQMRLMDALSKDMLSLRDKDKNIEKERFDLLNKLEKESESENMTAEERLANTIKNVKQVKLETSEAYILAQAYYKVKKEVEVQLAVIEKIIGAVKTQISVAEEFGMVNEQAYKNAIKAAKQGMVEQEVAVRSSMDAIKDLLKSSGLEFKIDTNVSSGEQIKQLAEQLKLYEDQFKDEIKKKQLIDATAFAQENLGKLAEKEGAIVRATRDDYLRYVKQQENATAAYESRLNTQRELMESAQFGMGASVEMMQKQVDLAYKMMDTYKKANDYAVAGLMTIKGVNEEHIKAIQNCETAAEAQKYITENIKVSADEQIRLNKYFEDYNTLTDKNMKQQLKIYELTKDIREGYLDAITEMAVGAGEFEKIIGTQDMGWTQLSKTIKDVTGIDYGNLMGTGGTQDRALTEAGVGVGITGRFGIGGGEFVDPEMQKQMNRRIYGYEESIKREKEERSKAASGVVAGQRPEVAGALRENREEIKKDNEDAFYSALVRFRKDGDFLGAVREGVKGGGFKSDKFSSVFEQAIGFIIQYVNSTKGSRVGGNMPGARQPTKKVEDALIRPGKPTVEFAPDDVIMAIQEKSFKKITNGDEERGRGLRGKKRVNDGIDFGNWAYNKLLHPSKWNNIASNAGKWYGKRNKSPHQGKNLTREEVIKIKGDKQRAELYAREAEEKEKIIAGVKDKQRAELYAREAEEKEKIIAGVKARKASRETEAPKVTPDLPSSPAEVVKQKVAPGKQSSKRDAFKAKHGFGTSLKPGYKHMTADEFRKEHFGGIKPMGGGKFSAGSMGGGKFSAGSMGGGKFSAGSIGRKGSMGGGKSRTGGKDAGNTNVAIANGATSAAQAAGMEATAEQQEAATSRAAQSQKEAVFGPTSDSNGGGTGGNMVITISLTSGLVAQIENNSKCIAELTQASK